MRKRVCYVKYLKTYGQLKIPVLILAYLLSLWHTDVNYVLSEGVNIKEIQNNKYKYKFFPVLMAIR